MTVEGRKVSAKEFCSDLEGYFMEDASGSGKGQHGLQLMAIGSAQSQHAVRCTDLNYFILFWLILKRALQESSVEGLHEKAILIPLCWEVPAGKFSTWRFQ